MENVTVSSATNELERTLKTVTIHVIIWGGMFILVSGNIGCFGNMLVFRSSNYRRQACFVYLFWETIASVFILDCILLTRILESGFQISLMDASDAFCKIREFISLVMYQSENTLFLFATLDRILSAQRSIKLRQWSNRVPLAYKIVLANALFWMLVVSHRLIFYTNSDGTCWAQGGAYIAFDTYLDVALSAVGSPLVVIILAGLLWQTVRNVRKRRTAQHVPAVAASSTNPSRQQQVDLQLTIMLLLQSILAIINYVPFGVYILYYMFTDGWIKSPLRIAWEQLIIAFIRLSSYLFAAGSFYVSMASNCSFRKQFLSMIGMKNFVSPVIPTSTDHRLTTRTVDQQA